MNIPTALWLTRSISSLGISLLTILSICFFSNAAQAASSDAPVAEQDANPELLAQTQRAQVIRRSVVRQTSFTDISQDYWASSFVYPLSERGVLEGFPNGMFMPTNGLTHAQFSALINKAFDVRAVRQVSSISGISRSYWAYSAIQKAYSMGFIDLDDIVANPERRLTRLD
ncbi:MAG: S-layer homology domain-containing protein, partial [Cyanobacteria bacterium J06636_28]